MPEEVLDRPRAAGQYSGSSHVENLWITPRRGGKVVRNRVEAVEETLMRREVSTPLDDTVRSRSTSHTVVVSIS